MTTGEIIKSLRKDRGYTQKHLAELTGLATITIQGYEANKYKPKLDQLQRIAQAFKVPVSDLIMDETPHGTIDLFCGVDEFKRKLTESNLTDDENKLLLSFNVLNSQGKQEALKRVDELTEIKKYTDPDQ